MSNYVAPQTGELQSQKRRGQVHVFRRRLSGRLGAGWPKNGPDPDVAVLAPPSLGHKHFRPTVAILTSLILAAAGCSGPTGKFATPESTLTTLKTAATNKDVDGLVECLSDSALESMAGQLRMIVPLLQMVNSMGAAMGAAPDPKAADLTVKMNDIVMKHVPAGAPAISPMTLMTGEKVDAGATREAGKVVADKKAFVSEVMKLLMIESPQSAFDGYEVVSLTTEGDSSTATVNNSADGKQSQIKLSRTNGLWKIDDLGSMTMAPTGPGNNMPPAGSMPTGFMPPSPNTPGLGLPPAGGGASDDVFVPFGGAPPLTSESK
jgi:hypothetical protein